MPVLLTLGNDHQKSHMGSKSHGDFLKGKHFFFSISHHLIDFNILMMEPCSQKQLLLWVMMKSALFSCSWIFLHAFFLCLFYVLSVSFSVIECLLYTPHGRVKPQEKLECSNSILILVIKRWRLRVKQVRTYLIPPHHHLLFYLPFFFYLYL